MRPREEPSIARLVLDGTVSGAAATIAMSMVMLAAQRLGLMGTQPPERIVEHAATATRTPATEEAVDVAAGLAHVAFGSAAGVMFAVGAARSQTPIPELLAVPWALTIWAVSYFGWVPALGILPPPTRDRPGRAWTMLVAHVVYGLALGAISRARRT